MLCKFVLLLVITLIPSSIQDNNRCATDQRYSTRVCRAILMFRESLRCDPREANNLRKRVAFLEGVLKAVVREKNARLARNNQRNCSGVLSGGKCYFLLDKSGTSSMKNRDAAQAACERKRASLALISTKPIYDVVYRYIKTSAKDFVTKARKLVLVWTGASYVNRQILLENNRPSNFAIWSSYHPMNRTQMNKIAIAVATKAEVRGMFDASPTLKLYPLCEKTAAP